MSETYFFFKMHFISSTKITCRCASLIHARTHDEATHARALTYQRLYSAQLPSTRYTIIIMHKQSDDDVSTPRKTLLLGVRAVHSVVICARTKHTHTHAPTRVTHCVCMRMYMLNLRGSGRILHKLRGVEQKKKQTEKFKRETIMSSQQLMYRRKK